jgi:hypothetical protein
MNAISDWFQNNWIDLARLLVQCAILAAVVRYGSRILAALRASQEQVGALLKLSVSDTVAERPAAVAAPEPSREVEPSRGWVAERKPEPKPEPEPEPEPVLADAYSRGGYAAEREHSLGGRVIGAPTPDFVDSLQRRESPAFTPWVSAPAVAPERLSVPAASLPERPSAPPWVEKPVRASGVNPWRKMVRWLQAPVRG